MAQVLHLKSAVGSHSNDDLSFSHQTTMAIGQIQIPLAKRMYPSDHFPIKGNFFTRCAPMYVPTYGQLMQKTAAFFVPYHQVAEDADAFFCGQKSYQGQNVYLRSILFSDFFKDVFAWSGSESDSLDLPICEIRRFDSSQHNNQSNRSGSLRANSDFHYDFFYTDYLLYPSTPFCYGTLTAYGRWVYKFLSQLGYQIPAHVQFGTADHHDADSVWTTSVGSKRLNMMPLLCAAKAYNDWMSNSAIFNNSQLSNILLSIRQNKFIPGVYNPNGILSGRCVRDILRSIRLMYESDYFTSSWLHANEVSNQAAQSQREFNYLETAINGRGDNRILYQQQGNELTRYDGAELTNISARGLQALTAFDRWVRRNNYSGSRDVQQIYSRFGIKPDYYKTHYAEVLGTTSTIMNVGDVTSSANSSADGVTAVLGDYAGKGIISDGLNIDYTASDHGHLFVFSWICVKPAYAFGFDREVLRTEPFDFFNSEFDGMSGDAISDMEVYQNPKSERPFSDLDTFGFTERYNDYRFSRDMITGDFRIYDSMSAWHFGRDLSAIEDQYGLQAQSDSFMYYDRTGSQYNRIFNITDGSVDTFYSTFYFDIKANRPMKSLSEVPDLGVGDTDVPKNGNVIN